MNALIIYITIMTITFCNAVNVQTTVYDGVGIDAADGFPFTKIGDKYYWFEDKKKLNWFEATNICRSKGAHLATIESEEEMQALAQHFVIEDYKEWFWIGANDLGKEGHFYWQGTGLAMNYTNWEEGQPDNAFNGENCVNIWLVNKKYTWNDNTCTNTCHFICELESPKTVMLSLW